MNRLKDLSSARFSLYIFYFLLAYMPLHIFLSTWIGTSFNILDFMKVAKDSLLIVGLLIALDASMDKPWFKQLLKDRLVWIIAGYGFLTVFLALIKSNDQDAEILGVVYNLRFLLFFIYGVLLAHLFDSDHLKKRALQIVLGVATLVLFFGIIQYTILPDSALRHVGYRRSNGVLPAFYIDDKPDLERVMSTLRDPNSLGSYIIIIISLAAAILTVAVKKGEKQMARGLLVLAALCLLFTFSRSAWIGTAAALLVLTFTSGRVRSFISKYKKKLALGTVALLCVVTLSGVLLRNSYLVQNVILHADESTVLENPNQLRARFFRESVDQITNEPFGHGPGTAGLASIRNTKQGVVLNENYYLQIGYEVGLVGLLLFLAILVFVGVRLWREAQTSWIAMGLLAGFVGLLITNLFVHIWSNEAVAYTWWGLAGLVLLNTRDAVRVKKLIESDVG